MAVLFISLGFLLFDSKSKSGCWACLLAGATTFGLVCIDQHRLQPWVWQFLILFVVLAFSDDSTARTVWRWLLIGIYGWSAWSKFDLGFCVQHGPFLLEGLFKSLGLLPFMMTFPRNVTYVLAGMIPIFELLVAIGLFWSPTRRIAVVGALVMHCGLLLALGPLGHQHRPGVLVWNLFFLVQNWILFGRHNFTNDPNTIGAMPREISRNEVNSSDRWGTETTLNTRDGSDRLALPAKKTVLENMGNAIAKISVITVLMWPLLEPFGYCDHWLAWAVYAAKPERVTVFLSEEEIPKLPVSMRQYVGPQTALDEWYPFRIDRWSLDAVYAPIYPQDRFQVGVALGLVQGLQLKTLRIVIEGPAHWWTGERMVSEFEGLESVETLADSYRCGARPRLGFAMKNIDPNRLHRSDENAVQSWK